MNINTSKISRWAELRHKIGRWLFQEEIKRTNNERATFIELQKVYEDKIKEFEVAKTKVTITDMVREQLKGFNPKLLDSEVDLPDILGGMDDQEEFLSKVLSLSHNAALPVIADYLTRNQVQFSATQAESLREINFGRATVNGISLMMEEVTRLATIHKTRHADEPEYDKFSVT